MKKNINAKSVVFVAIVVIALFAITARASAIDPTRPLGSGAYVPSASNAEPEPEPESIILNSILIRSDRKIAIINGKTVRENEIIPGVGARLKKIDIDSVTLQRSNKVWRVPLNKIAVRK
jgi:MSHA biogenesis protein MshK